MVRKGTTENIKLKMWRRGGWNCTDNWRRVSQAEGIAGAKALRQGSTKTREEASVREWGVRGPRGNGGLDQAGLEVPGKDFGFYSQWGRKPMGGFKQWRLEWRCSSGDCTKWLNPWAKNKTGSGKLMNS